MNHAMDFDQSCIGALIHLCSETFYMFHSSLSSKSQGLIGPFTWPDRPSDTQVTNSEITKRSQEPTTLHHLKDLTLIMNTFVDDETSMKHLGSFQMHGSD